jgi:NADH:ubiquinone oxidoreductase subunit C
MSDPKFLGEILLANQLQKNLPRLVKKSFVYYKQVHVIVTRSNLLALLLFCKNHSLCLYKNLVDITVYDVPGKNYRFCIIYSLKSHLYNARLFIYTYTNESI